MRPIIVASRRGFIFAVSVRCRAWLRPQHRFKHLLLYPSSCTYCGSHSLGLLLRSVALAVLAVLVLAVSARPVLVLLVYLLRALCTPPVAMPPARPQVAAPWLAALMVHGAVDIVTLAHVDECKCRFAPLVGKSSLA